MSAREPCDKRGYMSAVLEEYFDTVDSADVHDYGVGYPVRDYLAGQDPAIGPISETLKWGEPAYLTATSGSGSTIRLGVSRTAAGRPAIFFNCRTTLVDEFRDRFGAAFDYEGNRAVLLPEAGAGERGPLEFMLGRALTYHVRRRA